MQSDAGVEQRYLQSDARSLILSSLSRETLGKSALSKEDRRKNIWDTGEISLLGGVQRFESLGNWGGGNLPSESGNPSKNLDFWSPSTDADRPCSRGERVRLVCPASLFCPGWWVSILACTGSNANLRNRISDKALIVLCQPSEYPSSQLAHS